MNEQNQEREQTEQTGKTRDRLMKLRNDVFKGSDAELALALGRTTDEVQGWQKGEEIDEDGEMKIVNLAQERLGR